MGRLKKIVIKIIFPYGRHPGGKQLLKRDLGKAARSFGGSLIPGGADLLEPASERRVREFRNLLARGYTPENAMRISGVTVEDLDEHQ